MGKNNKNLQSKAVSEKEMVVLDLTNVAVDAPVEKEYQKFKLSTDKKKPNLFKRILNWFRK